MHRCLYRVSGSFNLRQSHLFAIQLDAELLRVACIAYWLDSASSQSSVLRLGQPFDASAFRSWLAGLLFDNILIDLR